eukprot:CCRYP_007896-RA/>CCRYP_007896-RA protein AED:0.46 eAED:0.46 QI:229/1/0.66/1/0.5/0.66/3/0/148
MTSFQSTKRRRLQASPRNSKCYLALFVGLLGLYGASSYETQYENWEDAPASREEFDHDNDPEVCGLPILTVEEWEAGRYWEGNKPVIVKNVTAGWAAMEHWKKSNSSFVCLQNVHFVIDKKCFIDTLTKKLQWAKLVSSVRLDQTRQE